METTTYHSLSRLRSGIRTGWIAAAALAFSLAGCVNYAGIHSDKEMAPPTQFASQQSLPSEGGKWPAMSWASQFGDPQLTALIDEALRGNPTIDQARARIEKASAYIGTAKSALYPNANGSYTWTRQRYTENGIVPPPYGGSWQSENSLLASVSWDLDLWGKNRERLRQAVSEQKVADAEAEEVRITLAASVASTYNRLALLYALRDIQVREVSNREAIARITEGRVSAGLDSNVERQTAYGETATSRSSVSDLDGQIKTVRYQLGALLGAGPDRGLQIAKPALHGGDVVALPDNLPADLLSRRPDIVAAYWKVDAAVHDVKEAKAEFYPDVNLSLAAGLDAFGWGRFLTAGSRQLQAAPAIHLPIFDAGALRAQLKGRYADFDYDVAAYNQTLINALSDVATQVTQIRSTDLQLVDARKALDAQSTAYQLAVVRYRSGLNQQLQVLNADDNRLAAETAVVNLEMGRRGQQIALIKALGGGFDASQAGLAATAETPIPAPVHLAPTN
ncbi:MarR family transcriptional regulator [Burkholderia ubonensis]|uniref:efflux transporter outer membrane subunit n=1 Tax=Burkholderia TaxID=32008 RepID=UPI0005AD12F4|nr:MULTISPECIES: efflux transporter outer membrane subunit [Burkholderia]KIP13743.1 efflux transporter, outer membrane factor (OMF) lipo, NodT family protein [Burkholderia sp. MSHR3999]KVA74639.1 MarR family transcriptional regulator [Burkholderia ubonensis]KVC97664.1 MarR family transcriptional regulator [Burkholderia ubonensis]KVD03257.1 MarR family transcriptional regulator [Burkholderia ubonensis]KVD56801.1 MarR family transcriptional regulator [Burkholderia ubonensis]